MKYKGHWLSTEGLRPDPQKVAAIEDMPAPTDVKGVQRLLGMVHYLSRFIPHLAEECDPLRKLTLKDSAWAWDSPKQEALKQLKKSISQATTLSYYDVRKPATLQADASSTGLGLYSCKTTHQWHMHRAL